MTWDGGTAIPFFSDRLEQRTAPGARQQEPGRRPLCLELRPAVEESFQPQALLWRVVQRHKHCDVNFFSPHPFLSGLSLLDSTGIQKARRLTGQSTQVKFSGERESEGRNWRELIKILSTHDSHTTTPGSLGAG